MAQYALADACGVDSADLRRWERGLTMPPASALAAFASYFEVPEVALREAFRHQCRTVTAGEGYVTAQPSEPGITPRRREVPQGRLKVLDLFCGAGGFSYGLEMTGAFAVTAGIDLLPDRMKTFAANHDYAVSLAQDIRSATVERLCEHALQPDIVVGGPPCQGFSSIRPFRGLTEDDQRNNLFESFVVVVSKARPRWFVLENVVGLIQHKRKAAFQAILDGFSELGYRVEWRVLNAALFGVPQNRERVVVVGSRDGGPFCWPEPTHRTDYRTMAGRHAKLVMPSPLFEGTLPRAVTAMEAIGDLPPVMAGARATEYASPPQNAYQQMMREGAEKLTLHAATRHSAKMLEIIRHSGSNRNNLPDGLTTSGFSSSYSRLDPDTPSVTLTVNFVHPSSNKCIHPHQDRALTPREGARIQGFPDAFQFCGSRTKIVKQIGNAVPPLLGKAIGTALIKAMR
jgi:DNA (cytosine-5)-methyltransferase 1